jgi:DNA-binding NarL/FixJ family response regulator
MTEIVRILIVEDNAAYARSLQEIIGATAGMLCIGRHATVGSCRRAFEQDKPPEADIILLDLKLPDGGGLSMVPLLRQRAPNAGIVVLTSNDDYRTVLEAIKLGVVGYVLKDTPVAELRRIIREVHEGGSVIDPQLSRYVLKAFQDEVIIESDPLSKREREVLELMAQGYVKKEVAEKLGISYSAVALYTSNIYEKLQVPNVAAAVATAIRKGLI